MQVRLFPKIMSLTQPVINYDTLLAHIQTLEIPLLDFVNHLQCTFHLEDVIGNGGAMTVYKALLRYDSQQDPIEVALKIPKQIIKETSRDKVIKEMLAAIRQEIRMMKSLEEDPHVVTLYGIAFQDLKPILVMELATSSLNDYLISKKDAGNRVTWETKTRFCCEVAEGIMSLHSVNIIHGDIKADNVLLFGNPANEDELVSKLSDFGYSSTMASIARGSGTGGTPNFWAPECTPRASDEMSTYVDKPTKDNYSYGLFVWQVATDGEVPYEYMNVKEIDEAKHLDKELSELMEQLPEDTPECFKRLVVGMTQYTPNEREDLTNVRAIISGISDININLNKDIKYTEAKKAFEINTKDLPQDIGGAKLKSLRSMPIPLSIKEKLFRTYEVAASKGDAEAAYFLSVCYGSEFGVKVDKTKMISWAIQAAKGGNLEGVKSIASSYGDSIDQLPDNRSFLFPWILKTAEAGHMNSQYFISLCYKHGISVERDRTKFEEWHEKYRNNRDRTQYEDSNFPVESALDCAAQEGNIEAIKFFLFQKMDVNTKNSSGFTPLLLAAAYGHTEVVKMLVTEFGADSSIKDTNGWTPLHYAARKGHIDTVKLLVIEFGADVNFKSNTGWAPLHFAAENDHIDTVKLLLIEFGADVNVKSNAGWTPLHLATQNSHVDIVKLLVIEFGADVIVKLNNGWTPLHTAAENGHLHTMKLLVIDFGADVNVKSNPGWTPLHIAAQNGHFDIVKLLVDELEADINAKDYEGHTPLIYSSGEKCKEVALALLDHPRANIYEKTEDRQTLLHLAVKCRQEIVVKILVEQFHLDVYAKDSKGQTPLELADEPPAHLMYTCDGCKNCPIIGERFRCTVCADFDFCSACYSIVNHFNGEHGFKVVELPSVKYLLTPC